MERIAEHLGETLEQAKTHFKAGKGSLIAYRGRVLRIGTIVAKTKLDGSCVFLDEHNRCTIHPVAPFGCAYFDTHMTKAEGDERLKVALVEHVTPEYQKLREEVTDATNH